MPMSNGSADDLHKRTRNRLQSGARQSGYHRVMTMLSRRRFLQFSSGFAVSGFSTATYGVGVEPLVRLRVADYHVQPRNWPAGLKLKIAAVADIHACEPWMSLAHIETIVAQTNALEPDIIVLLGDYVAGHRHVTRRIEASEWAQVLAGLKAPLGVHAILGNHDYWDDRTVQRQGRGAPVARVALEAVGIPVYENDVVRLAKDGHAFWLAGLGDQLAFWPARRFRPVPRLGIDDLAATLKKVTDDAPIILLAHEPDIARRVPARVSLQLSGHTHGGQVRLLGWSPAVPTRDGVNLAYGHVRTQCDVIVSGGLGCSIMPVRIGVPPEIVQVTVGGARSEAVS
jgi:predicted MPP superfamily phosphohydrolase